MRISVGLRAPPPETIQVFGARGKSGTMRAIEAAVSAVSVAAPSSALQLSNVSPTQVRKSLRSSDFGGGLAKNGCARKRAMAC
jgi:hypothetical protein